MSSGFDRPMDTAPEPGAAQPTGEWMPSLAPHDLHGGPQGIGRADAGCGGSADMGRGSSADMGRGGAAPVVARSHAAPATYRRSLFRR